MRQHGWTEQTACCTSKRTHETLIEIEADGMRNAYIKEEDRQSEMTVVRNEFERGQNSPSGVLDENIWATASGTPISSFNNRVEG